MGMTTNNEPLTAIQWGLAATSAKQAFCFEVFNFT